MKLPVTSFSPLFSQSFTHLLFIYFRSFSSQRLKCHRIAHINLTPSNPSAIISSSHYHAASQMATSTHSVWNGMLTSQTGTEIGEVSCLPIARDKARAAAQTSADMIEPR